MALPLAIPPPTDDPLILALNTVKLQMVSMKKFLVSLHSISVDVVWNRDTETIEIGGGPADGCSQECEHHACGTAHFVTITESIL